jgi:hypothetical protein
MSQAGKEQWFRQRTLACVRARGEREREREREREECRFEGRNILCSWSQELRK